MKLAHYIAALLVSLLFNTAVHSQHYPSRQYMTSDGMPSNSVYDIAQTESGLMWFMSRSGPTYYDATEWHYFPDSLNLPISTQSKIIAAGDVVWAAGMNKTSFTVQYFRDGRWSEIETPIKDKSPGEAFSFLVVAQGDQHTVFIGYEGTLYVMEGSTYEISTFPIENVQIHNIKRLDNKVYLCTSNGLYLFENQQLTQTTLPEKQLPNRTILDAKQINGKLHLLGLDWYAELVDLEVTYLATGLGINKAALVHQSSMVIDKTGTVIFGAFAAPRILNKKTKKWQIMLIDGKEVNIGSSRVFCDQENNIWVSDSRGLFKFNILQFTNYNRSSGLFSDEVTAVLQHSDGSILLANPLALNILDSAQIESFPLPDRSLYRNRILDLQIDKINQRILIVANEAGLLALDRNRSEQGITLIDNATSFTSIESLRNRIYLSATDGIYELVGNDLIKRLGITSIRNMKVAKDKLLLLSNSSGVIFYDGKDTIRYRSTNFALSSVYSMGVYEDELIFATADGLAIIKNKELVPWDQIDLDAPVYGLMVDDNNRLWLGTDHGVYYYDSNELTLFDQRDGLVGNEINRNALIQDSQKRIWIGTEKGVSVLKEDLLGEQNYNLEVKLVSVRTSSNNELIELSDIQIPFDENNLSVSFRCHSYVDESQINFRYRLKNYDKNWIARSSAINEIAFTNLAAGAYEFEIQARPAKGSWGKSTSLSFQVKPPFYETAWFIISCLFLLVLGVRLVFHYRYLLLIRQQKRLKELVAQRTQEIALLNEQLEEKVKKRTAELEKKNVLLEEYAYINAHHLRGPLTKIMSAIYVAEIEDHEKLDVEMIKILKDAVEELDAVIYSINGILRADE